MKKTSFACHRRPFISLIHVSLKVGAGDVLRAGLRFEQCLSRNGSAAAQGPDSRRVLALREDNARVVKTFKRLLEKAEERSFVSVVGGRERDVRRGKRVRMHIDNGIDIIPAGEFS